MVKDNGQEPDTLNDKPKTSLLWNPGQQRQEMPVQAKTKEKEEPGEIITESGLILPYEIK